MASRSNSSNKQGIDIAVAMEILGQRNNEQRKNPVTHRHHDGIQLSHSHSQDAHNASGGGCPTCGQHPDGKIGAGAGGQVIDLYSSSGNEATSPSESQAPKETKLSLSSPKEDENEVLKQQSKNNDHDNNRLLLIKEISNMELPRRIQVVLQAQQDRVATYRQFDEGLRDVFCTGNFTMYPAICAQVTATFAVLSNTVNAVRAASANSNGGDNNNATTKQLQRFLAQLQENERDKLNFTAALHLEQIRLQQSVGGGRDGDNNGSVTTTTQDMYESSIRSLREKIGKCVENINEVLEELRCLLLEEE